MTDPLCQKCTNGGPEATFCIIHGDFDPEDPGEIVSCEDYLSEKMKAEVEKLKAENASLSGQISSLKQVAFGGPRTFAKEMPKLKAENARLTACLLPGGVDQGALLAALHLRKGPDFKCGKCGKFTDLWHLGGNKCPHCGTDGYLCGSHEGNGGKKVDSPEWREWVAQYVEIIEKAMIDYVR